MEKIPLIPSTPEEMGEMLQLCSYVRFKVPQQVWDLSSHQAPASCQGALASTAPFVRPPPCTYLSVHSTSVCTVAVTGQALCWGTATNE